MDELLLAARLRILKQQEIPNNGKDDDGDGLIDEPPTFEEKRKTTINPKTQKPAKVETSQTYVNPTEEGASQIQAGRSTASDGTNPTQAAVEASSMNPFGKSWEIGHADILKARLYAQAIDPNHPYTMEQWDIDKGVLQDIGSGVGRFAEETGKGLYNVGSALGRAGVETGKDIASAAGKGVAGAADLAGRGARGAAQFGAEAGKGVVGMGSALGRAGVETAQDIGSAAAQGVKGAADLTGKVAQGAAQVGTEMAKVPLEAGKVLGGAAVGTAQDLGSGAVGLGQNIASGAKQGLQNAGEAVSNLPGASLVQEGVSQAKDAVQGADYPKLQALAEVGGLPTIGRVVRGAAGSWQGGVSDKTGGAVIPKQGTMYDRTVDHAKDYASGVLGGESVFDPKNATIAGQNERMGIDDTNLNDADQTESGAIAESQRLSRQEEQRGQMARGTDHNMPLDVDGDGVADDADGDGVADAPAAAPDVADNPAAQAILAGAGKANVADTQAATARSKTSGGMATNPWLGLLTGRM